MLVARDWPGEREKALALLAQSLDTAQALGMKRLLERALALKLRVQGIVAAARTTSIDAVASTIGRERPDPRSHAAPEGTVTILFTDLEGSTAMIERLGDHRAQVLLRTHNALVREQVAAHGGFEVKAQGDGFMLAFASARRALLCAIAVQRALARYNAGHPEEPMRVRIEGARMVIPNWLAIKASAPIIWLEILINRAHDAVVREDLAGLPAALDQVDGWIRDGTLGGAQKNAADFQIATSIRLLLCFDELRPLIDGRPAASLAERLVPSCPGHVPRVIPPAWLPLS